MQSDLDLLVAGLLSHGFLEQSPEGDWRRFGRRLGKEDRWLRESDLSIWIGDSLPPALCAGVRPQFHSVSSAGMFVASATNGIPSSYHRLLRKCGEIWLRHRERKEEERRRNPPKGQTMLLDADAELEALMQVNLEGSDEY